MSLSERYVTILDCAGRTFVFSRKERPDHMNSYATTMRVIGTPGITSRAFLLGMSSNAGFVCLHNRTIVAFGGSGDNGGVRIMTAVATDHTPQFRIQYRDEEGFPMVIASAIQNVSGCIELVLNRVVLDNGEELFTCAFDGQMSVVHWGRRLVMFGRANACRLGGGRHVQAAIGDADGRTFDGFRALRFEGWERHEDVCANSIYMCMPLVVGDKLFGLFPGILPATNESGIFCSSSEDAFNWAAPTRIYSSPPLLDQNNHPVRTRDWPVNMQYAQATGPGSRVSLNSTFVAVSQQTWPPDGDAADMAEPMNGDFDAVPQAEELVAVPPVEELVLAVHELIAGMSQDELRNAGVTKEWFTSVLVEARKKRVLSQ